MKPVFSSLEYLDPEKVYSFSDQLENDIGIEVYIQIHSDKFVDYQKEIFQEFVADFVDQVKSTALSSRDVEELLEKHLQNLNTKLQSFADKLRDVPKCDLRGYVQVILDEGVKTWMIGKTTLLIFRGDKLYSLLENSYQEQSNVDQFSDFIGWELERWDVFLYAGTKLSEVLDQNDYAEIEAILAKENAGAVLDYLDDLFASRIEKQQIWFLWSFSITGVELSSSHSGKLGSLASKYTSKLWGKFASKVDLMKWKYTTKKVLKGNNYYLMVGVLTLAVLFLSFSILAQLRSAKKNQITFQTSTGSTVLLTIDDIKRDIASFKELDPSSDEKSLKYSEILQKLSLIEQKGIWQEDTAALKKILNQDYEKGFMVRTISDLAQFDDEKTGRKTAILTFNASEKNKLWTPVSVNVDSAINVAGEKSALIGVVNDATRGSLVEYNLWWVAKECSSSISKKGLFCYTEGGELFYVGKLGIEPMEVVDNDWATKTIWGIGVFGRNNFYLFQANPNNIGAALLTRYRNVAGSESKYQNASNYTILAGSGANLPQQLGGFAIDGNFLAWGDGKMYQFRRASNVGSALDYREVPMLWGDKVSSSYSNTVKIIATASSPFVYLFDKENQTFTVYESSPTKTHENYKTSFKLYYMFRFKFDLSAKNNRIIDVTIPENTGDRPELYLLSTEGVNKINLYDFIDSLKNNKNLKAVSEAE